MISPFRRHRRTPDRGGRRRRAAPSRRPILELLEGRTLLSVTGDFNGDGKDDLLWRGADGSLTNWFGQANGGFSVNPDFHSQIDASWHTQPENLFF